MREGFRHPIGAPHVVGEGSQGGGKGIVDRTASDNQMTNPHQAFLFGWHLQGVIDLHRDHRSEVNTPPLTPPHRGEGIIIWDLFFCVI